MHIARHTGQRPRSSIIGTISSVARVANTSHGSFQYHIAGIRSHDDYKLPASAVLSSDTLHDSYSVGDKRTAAILCQLRVVRYVQDYGCSLDAGSNDSLGA